MEAAKQIIGKFNDAILNPAILVVFTLGFFLFVWGLVQFLKALNEGGDAKEGKQHMLWGVAGMFIMVSVYGIIALISNTFGLGIDPRGSYNPDMSRLQNINVGTLGQ
ncbi:MAG TPA: hypothetical protein VJG64_04600 [Candidatus Paceibacterota bacterium]